MLGDIRDATREVLLTRCEADGWTPELRRCFVVATSEQDEKACFDRVPLASSGPLEADFAKAMTNLRRSWIAIESDKIKLAHPINFVPDTAELSPLALPVIRAVAEALAADPKLRVEIDAHVDGGRDPTHDRELSQTRADEVRNELLKDGTPATRAIAKGLGSEHPLDPSHDAQGQRVNTRVELRIVP